MDVNKIAAVSSILVGIVFILQSGGLIYILLQMSSAISALAALPGAGEAVTGMISPYLTIGWLFAILTLVAGIVTFIAGIGYLAQKG